MSGAGVSIVIPTWNRAGLVGEAIQSALEQTWPDCEVIVVDDGSGDETAAALARFGGRIRVVRQARGGCARARNAGAALARGRYLTFLDSDDRLAPEHAACLTPVLEADPAIGFAYADGWHMDADGRPLERVPAMGGAAVESGFAEAFFERPYVFMPAVLIRAEAFRGAAGFDESLLHNEDSDLLLRLAMRWPVRHVPTATVWVRLHPGRKSAERPALYRGLVSSALRAGADPAFAARLGRRLPRRLGELHYALGRLLAGDGRFAEARAVFREGRRLRGAGMWRAKAWGFSTALGLGDLPARMLGKGIHLWESGLRPGRARRRG